MSSIGSRPLFALAVFLSGFAVAIATSTGSGSTSIPFGYSETDLEACARIDKTVGEGGDSATAATTTMDSACLQLYEQFRKHYHGSNPSEEGISSSPSSGYQHFVKTAKLVHQHNTRHRKNGGFQFQLRLNQFADTQRSYTTRDATIVSQNGAQQNKNHPDKVVNSWQVDLEDFWEDHNQQETDATAATNENGASSSSLRGRKLRWNGMDVRLLDTPSSILVENEYQHQPTLLGQESQEERLMDPTHTKNRHLKRKKRWHHHHQHHEEPSSSTLRVETTSQHQTKVRLPGDGTNMPAAFSSPRVPSTIYGTEVELHKGGQSDVLTGSSSSRSSLEHKFSKSLDWSTEHNPDGLPLVHGVYDQGSCGSCWAFAATGSVEASAARNTARDYFVHGLAEINEKIKAIDHRYDDEDDDYDDHDKNVVYNTMFEDLTDEARRIESDTFQELNLSIQELLDCDTSVDEGCIGGNPALAFYYIHKRGLVPWKEYPYVGYGETATATRLKVLEKAESTHPFEKSSLSTKEGEFLAANYSPTCQKEKVAQPIATVESWGLLHKNHEELIEYTLLYVGPVAVGINAADPSFINYGGGIFDKEDCDQTANHALLIVGYGEEETTNTEGEAETIRYWIARNSWGETWGENGFVRVRRGTGEKGVPGVCGIARSPSVALGGLYRPNREDPLANKNVSKGNAARYRKDKYVTSFDTSASLNMYMRKNHPVCDSTFSANRVHLYNGCVKVSILYNNNRPIFLALICFLCALIAIIPLVVSLSRQHRAAVGNRSIFLEYFEDEEPLRLTLSERSRASSSSGTLSERTHLLTLKDMYADARKQEEKTKRPRGRSIVMTSPERDPFHLVPSASFDGENSDKS